MKEHKGVTAALTEARSERRCAYGTDAATRRALNRRADRGELVRPYRGLFIEAETWHGLNVCERTLHMARALALLHEDWVFAGLTAADAHGFEHAWSLHDSRIRIADTSHHGLMSGQPIERIYMREIPLDEADGLIVTDAARTVIDCALSLPFENALSIMDSALRAGMKPEDALEQCAMLPDSRPVRRLIAHADARSENGGESWARAIILQLGFAKPELQIGFGESRHHRVDFLWRLHDGRIIVLEFDGTRKYVDPTMTGTRTVREVVGAQIERDQMLKDAGVTSIIHCFHDEVAARMPLYAKLRDAGVPWVGVPADLI